MSAIFIVGLLSFYLITTIIKMSVLRKSTPHKSQPSGKSTNHFNIKQEFLLQPKTAPEEGRYPIFVALERGLNVSLEANIQPAGIESQI